MHGNKIGVSAVAEGGLHRNSPIEDSLDMLRVSVGCLEDNLAGLTNRLSTVLSGPLPTNPVAEKVPQYGVPLADTIQQITGRLGSLNAQTRELLDRLGV